MTRDGYASGRGILSMMMGEVSCTYMTVNGDHGCDPGWRVMNMTIGKAHGHGNG